MVVIDEEFSDYSDGIVTFKGIRDTDLFLSALEEPRQTFDSKDLYPDVLSKAACYVRSFALNHPFHDGNKRTALMAMIMFLEYNGYEVIDNKDKLYRFVESIVRGKLQIPSIVRRLKKFVKLKEKRGRKPTIIEFIVKIIEKSKNKK